MTQELNNLKLKIVQVGDPVLRAKARPLSNAEILSPEIQSLILQMKNTMHDAPGVGLAAPQVGLPLQLIVIEDREEFIKLLPPDEAQAKDRRAVKLHVLINPQITLVDPENSAEFYEGCLSVTGLLGSVARAKTVKVDALNEEGKPVHIEAHGWYARILQHEIDHLHGILCIDHMNTRTLATIENYRRFRPDIT